MKQQPLNNNLRYEMPTRTPQESLLDLSVSGKINTSVVNRFIELRSMEPFCIVHNQFDFT